MKFVKMQAYGNDYVYINNMEDKLENLNELSKFISNRHYGVGSDGMVLICPSKKADFKMRIFNPDGSEAEMCGNALRSVGKYVYEFNLTNKDKFAIETLGGIKKIELMIENGRVKNIKANIGSPILESRLIPVNTKKERFILEEVEVLDKTLKLSSLSWGNPHTVIFVDDVDNFDVSKYGRQIENLTSIFPNKTNVTFAEIIDKKTIKIREWERGTGETLGCATGCSSAVVIANMLGLVENICKVIQPGGDIEIQYSNNTLSMVGNSEIVFVGDIDYHIN